MKKLLFIIPKVFIFALFFTLLFSVSSFADVHRYGCWIPGTNKVWHTPVSPGSTNYQNDGVTGLLNGIDDGFNTLDDRCGNSTDFCEVFWNVSSYYPSGGSRGVGYLADYSIDYCPIDDYIPLLFIFTIGITLIKFKKVVPL
jgi:hypothetical protein